MKIGLASDHAGYPLKEFVKRYLAQNNMEFVDYGTHSEESCDYPDFAHALAEGMECGECEKGILICGTGIGMSICANKFKGIRAACCSDYFSAKATRSHNDANILCMGERVVGPGMAVELLRVFLETPFEGGRHQRRVDQIAAIENGSFEG